MPALHHNHPETEERTSATARLVSTGKHWTTYPQEWQDRIKRIALLQEHLQDAKANGLDWSDKEFTDGLPIANVWPSFRLGLYPLPSRSTNQTKWLRELDRLEQHAKAHVKRAAGWAEQESRSLAEFVETKDYRAVKRAIEEARKRATTHNQDRAVAYVAKTGGGKTTLAMRLMEEGIVDWYAEATPSWKRSYRAMLLSLASTWALPVQQRMSTLDLETAIIRHAKSLSGVLLVEEVDTLCSSSQEFLKLLLNRSTLVICIFMTPEARQELLKHGGSQLAQLFRRFEAQIVAAEISRDDITAFQPDLWQRTTPGQRELVAKAANAMGSVDAVKRIGSNLATLAGENTVDDATVEKAIRLYRMAVPVVNTQNRRAA